MEGTVTVYAVMRIAISRHQYADAYAYYWSKPHWHRSDIHRTNPLVNCLFADTQKRFTKKNSTCNNDSQPDTRGALGLRWSAVVQHARMPSISRKPLITSSKIHVTNTLNGGSLECTCVTQQILSVTRIRIRCKPLFTRTYSPQELEPSVLLELSHWNDEFASRYTDGNGTYSAK